MWIHHLMLAAFIAAGVHAFDWDEPTPLDDYVHFDDGYFEWTELTSYRFEENQTTVYMLNMTSQKWMDATFSSRPIWSHMMGVAIPDNIVHEVAYVMISAGDNDQDEGLQPLPEDDIMVQAIVVIAQRTGCIAGYVLQVPNQPIVFANDPDQEEKREDNFIAWTWLTWGFLGWNETEIVARMPMTKAAKRAFDTVEELVLDKAPGTHIDRFIPAGASKRGWTTWSVAATDQRVIACNPIVFSLLNMNTTLQNHFRNLDGAWSFALGPYWNLNLTKFLHTNIVTQSPGGLWDYEDMYRYKERLGLIPKFAISASGDEFFSLVDSHGWWGGMPGEKWLMMVPNAEHALFPWYLKISESVLTFINSVTEGWAMPYLSWFRMDTPTGGLLRFSSDIPPENVTVWRAYTLYENHTRKDFRLAVGYPPYLQPVRWYKIPYQDLGDGHYLVEVDKPPEGFVGFFFEATYRLFDGMRLMLTSEVHVSPETFPADPCYGVDCYGYLI